MRTVIPAIVAFAAASCASYEQQPAPTQSQTSISITTEEGGSTPTVRLTRDMYVSENEIVGERLELWRLIPDAFEAVGLPLPVVDPRAFSASVEGHAMTRQLGGERLSTFLECGSGMEGPNADTHRIRLDLRTWIEPGDSSGRSIVRTRVDASASNIMHGSSGTTHCSSRGRLEMAIREELRRISVQRRLESIRGTNDSSVQET